MKNRFKYILLAALLSVAFSCAKDDFVTHINRGDASEIRIVATNTYPAAYEPVTFEVIAGAEAGVKSVKWSFGDDQSAELAKVEHSFTTEGEYVVQAVIATESGDTRTEKVTVTVAGMSLSRALRNFDKSKVWICAHRGNSGNAKIPENSIASIQNCIAMSNYINMVEIDIRPTKDGIIVLMHDETVDRTTTGSGKVSDLTYAQIKQLKLKLADGTVTQYSVPTLEEALLAARGRIYFDLDFINKVSPKEMFEIVNKVGMLDQVILYTATQTDVINSLKEYSPLSIPFTRCDNEAHPAAYVANGILISQVSTGNVLNTNIPQAMTNAGLLSFTNILNQNGYYYDRDMVAGDYTGVNLILAKNINVIQTDYPAVLHEYLYSLGKR